MSIPWLPGSLSQIGQESFVAWVLENKKRGCYLEIGAFEAHKWSNTFILERDFAWVGFGLEIDPIRTNRYNEVRRNKAITADATTLNCEEFLNEVKAPSVIDFLQVDIEPARNTYMALRQAVNSSRIYQVITFEHDLYAKKWRFLPLNYIWKLSAHFLLASKGYVRVVSNVSNQGKKQEDWFIHRIAHGSSFKKLKNIDFRDIFSLNLTNSPMQY